MRRGLASVNRRLDQICNYENIADAKNRYSVDDNTKRLDNCWDMFGGMMVTTELDGVGRRC